MSIKGSGAGGNERDRRSSVSGNEPEAESSSSSGSNSGAGSSGLRRSRSDSSIFRRVPRNYKPKPLRISADYFQEPLSETVPELPPILKRSTRPIFVGQPASFPSWRGNPELSAPGTVYRDLTSYPRPVTRKGVRGHLHTMRFPAYEVCIPGGSVVLNGVQRTFAPQTCIGRFPLQIRYVPYNRVYKGIRVQTPQRIEVWIRLDSPERKHESYHCSIHAPSNLRWVFFPQAVEDQEVPSWYTALADPRLTYRVYEVNEEGNTVRPLPQFAPSDPSPLQPKSFMERLQTKARFRNIPTPAGISPLLQTALMRRTKQGQQAHPASYEGEPGPSRIFVTRDYPVYASTTEELTRSREQLPPRLPVEIRPKYWSPNEWSSAQLPSQTRGTATFKTPSGRVHTFNLPVSSRIRDAVFGRPPSRLRTGTFPPEEPGSILQVSVTSSPLGRRSVEPLPPSVLRALEKMSIEQPLVVEISQASSLTDTEEESLEIVAGTSTARPGGRSRSEPTPRSRSPSPRRGAPAMRGGKNK